MPFSRQRFVANAGVGAPAAGFDELEAELEDLGGGGAGGLAPRYVARAPGVGWSYAMIGAFLMSAGVVGLGLFIAVIDQIATVGGTARILNMTQEWWMFGLSFLVTLIQTFAPIYFSKTDKSLVYLFWGTVAYNLVTNMPMIIIFFMGHPGWIQIFPDKGARFFVSGLAAIVLGAGFGLLGEYLARKGGIYFWKTLCLKLGRG